MGLLVGTDEAGYGPMLGPLVISVSVWQVDAEPDRVDLYKRLRQCIAGGGEAAGDGDGRVAIADSKVLYSPKRGLARLERGVLAAVAQLGQPVESWRRLWHLLAPETAGELDGEHWNEAYDCPLPVAAEADDMAAAADVLRRGLATAGVSLAAVSSRAVFPAEFNRLVAEHGSKGTALTDLTLRLVRDVLDRIELEPLAIVCDKHGGRNRYGPLVQQYLQTDEMIGIVRESRAESRYRCSIAGTRKGAPQPATISFRAGGESFLPTALASMTSKYLREMAMRAFNHYWCQRVPNLRPTAGYYRDALRFRDEIRDVQQAIGIAEESLWRAR